MNYLPEVHWLNLHPNECHSPGMWDQHWLETQLLKDLPVKEKTDFQGGVVIVPGRFHNAEEVAQALVGIMPSLIIVTSDEEGVFDTQECHKLTGQKHRWWQMTPQVGKSYPAHTRFIGCMPTEHSMQESPNQYAVNDWFFAGQITHPARVEMAESLRRIKKDKTLLETEGFAQGFSNEEYVKRTRNAKLIPCPPGPASPDSFRFYEALELGCIPIINKNDLPYWNKLFGKAPPVIYTDGWSEIVEVINGYDYDKWLKHSVQVLSWWSNQKHNIKRNLCNDLISLGYEAVRPILTWLIASSPIHSHPSTAILSETIDSLPIGKRDELVIMFDGVRNEQKELESKYYRYARKTIGKYREALFVAMPDHKHQAVMTKRTLRLVSTPYLAFIEHDCPLVGDDKDVMTKECLDLLDPLLQYDFDLVRLHHEASILPPHEHLMIDHADQPGNYRRTVQWSQRPHFAKTAFYKRILKDHFPNTARTMIEDKMHSVVQTAWSEYGLEGWSRFKLAVYCPSTGINIKRSTHLDGRGDEPKYEMKMK